MERVEAARGLVLGHVRALEAIDEAARAAIPSLGRLTDLLGPVRSRRVLGRRGRVGAYSYTVHGAGCLFVGDDGAEVDVDFTADGTEVFDLWRLRRYGLSLPEAVDVTDEDLRSAVRSLGPLLAEVRPGWFGVARRPLRDGDVVPIAADGGGTPTGPPVRPAASDRSR